MFKYTAHKMHIETSIVDVRCLCVISVEEADRLLNLSPYVDRNDFMDDLTSLDLLPKNGYCVVDIRHDCVYSVVYKEDKFYLYTAHAKYFNTLRN